MKTSFSLTRIIEIFLLLWIISSLFYDPADRYGAFIQPWFNTTGKFLTILLIVWISFIDLQLAIILVIAFFILVISFNKKSIQTFKDFVLPNENNIATFPAKPYQTMKSISSKFDPDTVVQEKKPKVICNITPYDPEAINDKIFALRRDPKFDDYDEYINMISSPDQIESAQDNTL